ncbi:ABC transporter G family member 23-like [Cimex lectularius]|uniref:ABC transporter domain-containing protein n=1 Tax=Cimex lectularius TaxID=79782 RepID=A0A8I6TCU4_CIMLE|nr:ABC transporter G family member 23-like [Cimex lectularius]
MDPNVLVNFKNVYKKYEKNWILRGLNLSIHKSTIYSLLGPSGSGKTTIIGLILGELQPDFGDINWGEVHSRKEFGYMPQATSLYEDLTIKESCVYYSYLFGLGGRIPKKAIQLLNKLEIFDLNRLVCTLSGGEQRRVSFVIALIHEPSILLLDEPTASLDCLHSKIIWEHLAALSGKGTTILLTTHYVQEAVNSTKVGFLRKGNLIAEDKVTEFIDKHGTSNLDNIFVQLCAKDIQKSECIVVDKSHLKCASMKIGFQGDRCFKWPCFYAQLAKNLITVKRNLLVFFCNLCLPIVFALFFGMAIGRDLNELSLGSVSGTVKISDCKDMGTRYDELLRCELPERIECFIFQRLEERFKMVDYDDFTNAFKDLQRARIHGILKFERNFSSSLSSFYGDVTQFKSDKINDAIIVSHLDSSDYVKAHFLKKFISKSVMGIFKDIDGFCNSSKTASPIPLKFEQPIYGSAEAPYSHSLYPAYVCVCSFIFTIVFSTPALLVDKKHGCVRRNMISGLTYMEMVAAHLVIQVVLMLLQDILILGTFIWILGYPQIGRLSTALSVTLSCNINGIAIAFFVVELFKNDLVIMLTSIGAMNLSLLLGGILWPPVGYPKWLQWLCYIIPNTSTSNSLQAVALKGSTPSDPSVYRAYIECSSWIVICILVCNCQFRKNK